MFKLFKLFDRFDPRLADDVAAAIVSVAAATIESDAAFRQRAFEVAQTLKPESIHFFRRFFHSPPEKPESLADHYNGLGQWMAVCQFAAFEIIFNFREAGLPLLRKIAFGKDDWTPGNAIEILCRLAAEGVERDKILSDLRRKIPYMWDEPILGAVGPLLEQAASNPAIEDMLKAVDVERFQDIVEELRIERQKN